MELKNFISRPGHFLVGRGKSRKIVITYGRLIIAVVEATVK